ncbi:sensor domain-containing diguanylate cyclase [Paenibacillus humicola]|uniref:GGDEF domain-containing protein n=1 Tax=Paenibacillus humicola TaxID=3110540 RepID=UPI00237BFFF1|nr:GGDEF domain-containing protein [Paenibacillus humicola]
MDYETLDFKRSRWNRTLLNGFWSILLLSIFLECLYLTITELPTGAFILHFMVLPFLLQLGTLLAAETALRLLSDKFQDYVIILTSTLLAFIIVDIHDSITYLLIALFLPVMVSIFYFHPKKLLIAYFNTLCSLYLIYWTNGAINSDITIVGMGTITVMFSVFTLIAWGILLRGRELMNHLKTYLETNQELLVQNVWMDKLSKTDALTELYNHMTFHEYFEKLIEQNDTNELSLQLAILDIDNFKQVNDTYGHRAGDAVLKCVAELIRSRVHANDFVARYGGEEFAILFTDKKMTESLHYIEQIRQEVMIVPHDALSGKPVTVSIGFGEYVPFEGKEAFFNRVDESLYRAKSSGKNRTVVAALPDEDGSSRLA